MRRFDAELLGIFIAIIIGLAIGLTAAVLFKIDDTPHPYQVTNKIERDGRCYVETWVEVTPEEYIGLEVGDEFELK